MALIAFAALNMLTPSEAFAQDGGGHCQRNSYR